MRLVKRLSAIISGLLLTQQVNVSSCNTVTPVSTLTSPKSSDCGGNNSCSQYGGCWSGSTVEPSLTYGNSCTVPQEHTVTDKDYRLKSATGYNQPDVVNRHQFAYFSLVFEDVSDQGRPDIVQDYGPTSNSYHSKDEITFSSEVIGLDFVVTNDIEGLCFLEENGTMQRIGRDQSFSMAVDKFDMLDSRLQGFQARMNPYNGRAVGQMMHLTVTTDSNNCDLAVFSSTSNPFVDMEVDVIGTRETQTYDLSLAPESWPDQVCSYTPSTSNTESWLTLTDTIIRIFTNDLSLADTTTTVSITFTPDCQHAVTGLPLAISHSFDVTFTCTVTGFTFTTILPHQVNFTLQVDSTQSFPFVVTQTPACDKPVTWTLNPAQYRTASWVTLVPGSHIEISPTDLSLAGFIDLNLNAAIVGTQTTTGTRLVLAHPCAGALFTTNPFNDMTVPDLTTGTTESQTQTLSLSIASLPSMTCTYTASKSNSGASWLSFSQPDSDSVNILVTSTDTSLAGTTITVNMIFTPDYQDSNSLPAAISYSFDATFICDVTSLAFDAQLGAYSHILLIDTTPATLSFSLSQTPACDKVLSYAESPSTYSWLSLVSSNIQLSPNARNLAATYSITITASEADSGVSQQSTLSLTLVDPCALAVFTPTLSPFTTITHDVGDSLTDTQTRTINLGYLTQACTFTAQSTSHPWLTFTQSVNQIQIDVASTDLSLTDTSSTVTITLTPDYQDSNGNPPAIQQSLTVDLICIVRGLAWSEPWLPNPYSHIIIVDQSPVSFPFSIIQTPACAASLTYAMTGPTWLSIDAANDLVQIDPVLQSDAGTHSFVMSATEVDSSIQITTGLSFELIDPCASTTISAGALMPSQNLYLWKPPLSLSVSFEAFISDIMTQYNVLDCGAFTYRSQIQSFSASNTDSVFGLSVDQKDQTIEINLNENLLPYGLDAVFDLTGQLQNFNPSHTESFQVKVYKLDVINEQETTTYQYRVLDEPTLITFELEQIPDAVIQRELEPYALDEAGNVMDRLDQFMTLTFLGYAQTTNQVTLSISTQEFKMLGTYQVGFIAIYPGAEKIFTVLLEIKEPLLVFKGALKLGKPYFNETEAKDIVELFDDNVIKEEKIQMLEFDCTESDDWSFDLPSILDEDQGELITVQVRLGEAAPVLNYDPVKRTFTVKDPIEGIYFIQVTLLNKVQSSSLYGIIVSITCPVPPEIKIPSYEYVWSQSPPTPRIDSISSLGEVVIKFNATMDVDTALNPEERRLWAVRTLQETEPEDEDEDESSESSMITIDGIPQVSKKFNALQNSTIRVNETDLPSILVQIRAFDPDDYCLEKLSSFEWGFQSFEPDEMRIQLFLEAPECISASGNGGDELVIILYNQLLFSDKTGNLIAGQVTIKNKMKRMNFSEEDKEVTDTIVAVMATVVVSTTIFSLATQIFTNVGLKKLLEAIKNLTILTHVFLIEVFAVAHAEFFTMKLLELTSFEIVDLTENFVDTLKVEENDPLNVHFEAAGYETSCVVINSGSAFLTIMTLPVIILFLFILSLLLKCERALCLKNSIRRKLDNFFFNGMILFLDAELLLLMTAGFLTINGVKFEQVEINHLSYYLSYVIIACLILLVIFLCIVLRFCFKNLSTLYFQNRIGAIYSNLRLKGATQSILTIIEISFARRIILSSIIVFCRDYFLLQVLFIWLSSTIIIAIDFQQRPYETQSQQRLALFNELIVLFVCIHLICQTNFVTRLQERGTMGWSYIGIMSLCLLVNMSLKLKDNVGQMKLKCRMCIFKKRQAAAKAKAKAAGSKQSSKKAGHRRSASASINEIRNQQIELNSPPKLIDMQTLQNHELGNRPKLVLIDDDSDGQKASLRILDDELGNQPQLVVIDAGTDEKKASTRIIDDNEHQKVVKFEDMIVDATKENDGLEKSKKLIDLANLVNEETKEGEQSKLISELDAKMKDWVKRTDEAHQMKIDSIQEQIDNMFMNPLSDLVEEDDSKVIAEALETQLDQAYIQHGEFLSITLEPVVQRTNIDNLTDQDRKFLAFAQRTNTELPPVSNIQQL